MKKVVFGGGLLLLAGLMMAFTLPQEAEPKAPATDETINWMSWSEAMEAMETNPKKMFIDVYTDWCGWCKRMDAQTFTDPDVAAFMNEHFYAVKFDAEGSNPAEYKGRTLQFRPDWGRRGVHELAAVLLNGRLGYPSFVYLDESQNSLKVSPGFKTPDILMAEMQTIVSGN
jgi:thioredoxin-related protein